MILNLHSGVGDYPLVPNKNKKMKIAEVSVFAVFQYLTGTKTLPIYFYLVEEVLSFNLVGHMWKSVKNWLQEWAESDATLNPLYSSPLQEWKPAGPHETLVSFSKISLLPWLTIVLPIKPMEIFSFSCKNWRVHNKRPIILCFPLYKITSNLFLTLPKHNMVENS